MAEMIVYIMRIMDTGTDKYKLCDHFGGPAEGCVGCIPADIPGEQLGRWQTAFRLMEEVQQEMGDARKTIERERQANQSQAWREHMSREFGVPIEDI